ncbi:hypothetical protein L3Q82_012692 [Scortum barcoo]|uniref:Uncharacterized protein n=1 Tax=Scortum barcoo TaxID=214431 RepID=A0ACB8W318_9TELE|nr:hypothetical protein L3Q82_012692 [Scortum barcoo]
MLISFSGSPDIFAMVAGLIFLAKMGSSKLALLLVLVACVERCLSASCVVDSFTVKEDFDPKRYAGKWYALQKKDPEGLFLQDNISAAYTIDDDGSMTAFTKGRVTLFGFWVVCADMAAQYSVPDPTTPGKMFMNYQGLASYLSSGGQLTALTNIPLVPKFVLTLANPLLSLSVKPGDNYWVIDTDYDNYAITYACRTLKEDGSCEDGYALVFSRNPRGLPAPPSSASSVRNKRTSAWPESFSLCCSPEPAKEKKSERERERELRKTVWLQSGRL